MRHYLLRLTTYSRAPEPRWVQIHAADNDNATEIAKQHLGEDLDPFIRPVGGAPYPKGKDDWVYSDARLFEVGRTLILALPEIREERRKREEAAMADEEAKTAYALFLKLRERFETRGAPIDASAGSPPERPA